MVKLKKIEHLRTKVGHLRTKVKLHVNDKVIIIAGKNNGKIGKVLKLFKKTNRVLIEGVNKVKKHLKPGAASKEGGIIEVERPLNISNVMFLDEKTNKPSKLGYKVVEGKKYRLSKKSGEVILPK